MNRIGHRLLVFMLIWTIWRKLDECSMTFTQKNNLTPVTWQFMFQCLFPSCKYPARGNGHYFTDWQFMYYSCLKIKLFFLCRWNWIKWKCTVVGLYLVSFYRSVKNCMLETMLDREVAARLCVQKLQHNISGLKWKYSVGTKSKQWQKSRQVHVPRGVKHQTLR